MCLLALDELVTVTVTVTVAVMGAVTGNCLVKQ
jgi:hypothetical protein